MLCLAANKSVKIVVANMSPKERVPSTQSAIRQKITIVDNTTRTATMMTIYTILISEIRHSNTRYGHIRYLLRKFIFKSEERIQELV